MTKAACPAKWTDRVSFADHARHQCERDDEHEQHICRCRAYTFREFAVPGTEEGEGGQ